MPTPQEELDRIRAAAAERQSKMDAKRVQQQARRRKYKRFGPTLAITGLLATAGGAFMATRHFESLLDAMAGDASQLAQAIVGLSLGLAFGIIAHVILVLIDRADQKRMARTEKAQAVVEHAQLVTRQNSSSGRHMKTLALTLAYEINGEIVRKPHQPFLATTNSNTILENWQAKYPMGSEVDIWFNPGDPGDIGFKPPGKSAWLLPIWAFHLACWTGFGFGAMGLYILLS